MISGSNEKELDIANQIADLLLEKEKLEQENKQLKEDKKKAIEILKGSAMFYCEEDRQWLEELFKRILEILGDKE